MNKAWFILFLLAVVSCNENKGIQAVEESSGDAVYSFSEENEEMNEAIREAIRTYPLFEMAMQHPDTTLSDFSVKMRFGYGKKNTGEHMWLNELHMIGGQLFGVLNSEPMYVDRVQFGDTLRVIRDSISDWMYVKNGKLQGGYTIKVIYKNLNEKEKKEFKAELPFEIE